MDKAIKWSKNKSQSSNGRGNWKGQNLMTVHSKFVVQTIPFFYNKL